MGISELFNKGKEKLSDGINNAKDKYKEYSDANAKFKEIVENSQVLDNLTKVTLNSKEDPGRMEKIKQLGPNLSSDKVRIIDNLVDRNENILLVLLAKESKTGTEYTFVMTEKKLYLINVDYYRTFEFNEIKVFEIVVKGLLSHNVNFNNMGFNIEASYETTSELINVLTNAEYRNIYLKDKLSHLCGINLEKQLINKFGAGISVGENNKVVLHNGKDNHIIVKSDIERIDLLSDNSIIMTRGKMTSNFVSTKNGCYNMALKITTNNETYTIDIIPTSVMNSFYKSDDTVYQENYEFAKEVINELLNY